VPPGPMGDLPADFAPLVAVTAQPRQGPPAQREGVVPVGDEATP
jgi:hypothetical protein